MGRTVRAAPWDELTRRADDLFMTQPPAGPPQGFTDPVPRLLISYTKATATECSRGWARELYDSQGRRSVPGQSPMNDAETVQLWEA